MFTYGKCITTKYSVQRMIIYFPDTGVAVVSCYQKVSDLEPIGKICLKSCVCVDKQYFPIHCINDKLDFSAVKFLPVVQSVTALNYVSSLFRIGKRTAFKTMKETLGNIHGMSLVGNSPFLSLANDYGTGCIKFICLLYEKCITGRI